MKKFLIKLRNSAFFKGFGSILNLSGGVDHSKLPYSDILTDLEYDGFEKDRKALRSDWEAIGNDMKFILNQLKKNA